jgi:hypothetical protein
MLLVKIDEDCGTGAGVVRKTVPEKTAGEIIPERRGKIEHWYPSHEAIDGL